MRSQIPWLHLVTWHCGHGGLDLHAHDHEQHRHNLEKLHDFVHDATAPDSACTDLPIPRTATTVPLQRCELVVVLPPSFLT